MPIFIVALLRRDNEWITFSVYQHINRKACYIYSIELYLAIKKYKNIICRIIHIIKNDNNKQNKSYSNIVYFPLIVDSTFCTGI